MTTWEEDGSVVLPWAAARACASCCWPVLATRPGVVVITRGALLRIVVSFWLHVLFACHQCEGSETTEFINPNWRISTR